MFKQIKVMIDHIFDVKFSPLQPVVILFGAVPYLLLAAEKTVTYYGESISFIHYGVIVFFWLTVLCGVIRFP